MNQEPVNIRPVQRGFWRMPDGAFSTDVTHFGHARWPAKDFQRPQLPPTISSGCTPGVHKSRPSTPLRVQTILRERLLPATEAPRCVHFVDPKRTDQPDKFTFPNSDPASTNFSNQCRSPPSLHRAEYRARYDSSLLRVCPACETTGPARFPAGTCNHSDHSPSARASSCAVRNRPGRFQEETSPEISRHRGTLQFSGGLEGAWQRSRHRPTPC